MSGRFRLLTNVTRTNIHIRNLSATGVLYGWKHESLRAKEIGKRGRIIFSFKVQIWQHFFYFIFFFRLGSFTKVAIVGGCPQIIRKLEKIMYILLYFADAKQFYPLIWKYTLTNLRD